MQAKPGCYQGGPVWLVGSRSLGSPVFVNLATTAPEVLKSEGDVRRGVYGLIPGRKNGREGGRNSGDYSASGGGQGGPGTTPGERDVEPTCCGSPKRLVYSCPGKRRNENPLADFTGHGAPGETTGVADHGQGTYSDSASEKRGFLEAKKPAESSKATRARRSLRQLRLKVKRRGSRPIARRYSQHRTAMQKLGRLD